MNKDRTCGADDAELTQARSPDVHGWIKIVAGPDETVAPWDGNAVLICTDHSYGSRVHRAIWTDAIHGHGIHGWAVEDRKFGPYPLRGYMNVTHWQPLPAPPVQS
jgi:hypothetical protein